MSVDQSARRKPSKIPRFRNALIRESPMGIIVTDNHGDLRLAVAIVTAIAVVLAVTFAVAESPGHLATGYFTVMALLALILFIPTFLFSRRVLIDLRDAPHVVRQQRIWFAVPFTTKEHVFGRHRLAMMEGTWSGRDMGRGTEAALHLVGFLSFFGGVGAALATGDGLNPEIERVGLLLVISRDDGPDVPVCSLRNATQGKRLREILERRLRDEFESERTSIDDYRPADQATETR